MSDLVQQLRDRAYSSKIVDRLCEQAADEIELLRSRPCPYVTGSVTRYCTLTPLTLTDAEREAVQMAATYCETRSTTVHERWGSSLRGLLARLPQIAEHAGSAARDR